MGCAACARRKSKMVCEKKPLSFFRDGRERSARSLLVAIFNTTWREQPGRKRRLSVMEQNNEVVVDRAKSQWSDLWKKEDY